MFLRKLGIIMWKNLLLRKRQYIITSFEFFIPTIAALICVFTSYLAHTKDLSKPETILENILKSQCKDWCHTNVSSSNVSSNPYIAYTPITPETKKVLEQVVAELCQSSNGTIGLYANVNASELENICGTEDKCVAGIVFPDDLKALSTSPADKGATINYEIRMKNFVSSKLLPEQRKRECGMPEDDFTRLGPNWKHLRDKNEDAQGYDKKQSTFKYLYTGFLGLQLTIEKVLTKMLTGNVDFNDTISLASFPYPAFADIVGKHKQEGFRNFVYTFAFFIMFMIPTIARNVVGEKQCGMTELLRCAGVNKWIQSIAWLIHATIPHLITISIATILFCFIKLGDGTPVMAHSDASLVWVFFAIFVIQAAAFFYFICSLFQKSVPATTVAIIVYLLSSFLGFLHISGGGRLFPSKSELFACLFPVIPYLLAMRIIVKFDATIVDDSDKPVGTHWGRMTEACSLSGPYKKLNLENATLLELMLVQIFYIFLYMALAMYFEHVLPSQHGVKRPWYIWDWMKTKSERQKLVESSPPMAIPSKGSPDEGEHGIEIDEQGEAEPKPATAAETGEAAAVSENSTGPGKIGIDVQNLTKGFGNKLAVNGVSLQMYSGEIFALLGHKGSGKTTLIKMITGWLPPTSGTVIVDGKDLQNELDWDKARASIGLCLQQNLLFEHLTVFEHLWVFGMLRGRSMMQARKEAKALIVQMNFTDKANKRSKGLSLRQKRKLCVGIALIGKTKVVLLDEATIGMNSDTRHEIWELLLELKGERTILLATRYMEEADVLGGRIGIMAGGKLLCHGAAESLKKYFGNGYSLKITFGGGDDEEEKVSIAYPGEDEPQYLESDDGELVEIQPHTQPKAKQMSKEDITEAIDSLLATVKKRIPDAKVNSTVRNDPSIPEVMLMLPSETATTKALEKMLSDLTANRDELKIKTMGLCHASMEDVFLKVGELTIVDQQDNVEIGSGNDGAGGDAEMTNQETVKCSKVKSRFKLFGRFIAIFIKRCIQFIRRWGIWIFQILLPFAIFVIVVHFTTGHAATQGMNDPGANSTTNESRTVNTNLTCQIPMKLESYNSPITFYHATSDSNHLNSVIGASGISHTQVVDELLIKAKRDIKGYKRNHIVAFNVNRGSNPPEVVALYNTYPYHSAPLAINLAGNIILKYLDPSATRTIGMTSRPFGVCDDGSYPEARHKVENGTPKGKYNTLSQALALTTFLLPVSLLIIVTCFIIIPIEEKICQVKHLQSMAGASPSIYWGSFFIFDYCLVYVPIAVLMLIYLLIFDFHQVYTHDDGPKVFMLIVMVYGFSGTFFSYLFSLRASSVAKGFVLVILIHVVSSFGICLLFEEAKSGGILFSVLVIGRLFPTYSLTRAVIRFGHIAIRNSNCRLLNKCITGYTPYLTWKMNVTIIETTNDDENHLIDSAEVPGILQDLIILFVMGLLYAFILLIHEDKLWLYVSRHRNVVLAAHSHDEDIINEADRVNGLIKDGKTGEDCILIRNLFKSFDDHAVVQNVTFGVHHGEFFGLLGDNGAGKTTVLRLLTGDATLTMGEAYGFNTSMSKSASRFFTKIGYCTQIDGFIPDLTGKEMLQLFAVLRGITFRNRTVEAMNWLKKVGLLESADIRCKYYSGGMQRRLVTAMALIGDPPLILLDEPTRGLDPVSRRKFWKILDNCKDLGQSVILSSRSMEECEALCSRIGIMVNGEFECIGSPQHLKDKFAQGYSLTLKLKTEEYPVGTAEFHEKMESLNDHVFETFEPCSMTKDEEHPNIVHYHLEDSSLQWDVLFKALEELRAEFEDFIEEFAVNEISLEDVFHAFARVQHPELKSTENVSFLKRYLNICNL